MNVGAESVTDYGTYFAWGETSGYTSESDYAKKHFSWDTYAWCKGSNNTFTKYCPTAMQDSYWWDTSKVDADNKTQLEYADDAARANWGGAWRMPTQEEFEELIANTTVSYYFGETKYHGANGILLTSTVSGYTDKSIFLPAAGYRNGSSFDYQGSDGNYWSSTLYSDRPYRAWYLFFSDGYVSTRNYGRFGGYTVRAVLKN